MLKVLLLTSLLWGVALAEEYSPAKVERLIKKGSKVVKTLCADANLSAFGGEVDAIVKKLIVQKPCGELGAKHQEALAHYLANQNENNHHLIISSIEVPKDAKCPVCGMFVHKYPKWSALMVVEGETDYFDGVKDMMKYYIFSADFPYDRAKIEQFEVSDFYTLQPISAKEAYYVIGSDIFGPMGDELIPFETKEKAESFMRDHKGEKMVLFDEITDKMVMGLDGL